MTVTLSRNMLLGLLLLLLAWGGSAGIAFWLGSRTQDRVSAYAECTDEAWQDYRDAGDRYDDNPNNVNAEAEYRAAYRIYAAEHLGCSEQHLQ